MPKILLLCCCLLLLWRDSSARTEKEARQAWKELKAKPVTEENFRAVCDLAQDIGKSNINLYYEIVTDYIPLVKATGDRRRVHILLMSLAKTKVALGLYVDAEKLYQQIHANAGDSAAFLRTSLVGTVILYSEWQEHPDSLNKYFPLAERQFLVTNDKEALSFIYTFKALTLLNQPDVVREYLEKAVRLASGLPDRNALFTARYNYALAVMQNNPQRQIAEFESLLELAKDSSLIPNAKLYSGRLYSFGLATMSVYYQLTQLNLLLTDYVNAGKYGQLFYDMTIATYPNGADVPYISTELSIVKYYQGLSREARRYLDTSLVRFRLPEDKIPYVNYFIAAGMLAEHDGQPGKALAYYEKAYKFGNESYGLLLMPPGIYYAHSLVLNDKLNLAEKIFAEFGTSIKVRKYTALGFYYYKYYAEFLKARNNYPAYTRALDTFYIIKDSLTNLNQYRAIQEIETKMSVREKEQQINRLHDENQAKAKEIRQARIYGSIFAGLAAGIILLLVAYGRNQNQRKRQAQQITRQNEILQQTKIAEMEKQHRIEVMQGAIDAEENERHKIADQLHDEAGSMLALASLNISSALEKGSQDVQSQAKMEKAHEILTSVSSTIRDLSHRLTPLVIEKYGFRKAIEDMAQAINLAQKIKLETVIIGFEENHKYPVNLLNSLYRIAQELLHNVIKHARATIARLELVEHEAQIILMVEDNGIGIQDYTTTKGKGLAAIESKIAYLEGEMEVMKIKDGGALIVIEINVRPSKNTLYAHPTDHSR
ncbi:MAG TPA: ATP-binding protein [Puia sp.]|nr:ATP-binding protein [Puia sp.]